MAHSFRFGCLPDEAILSIPPSFLFIVLRCAAIWRQSLRNQRPKLRAKISYCAKASVDHFTFGQIPSKRSEGGNEERAVIVLASMYNNEPPKTSSQSDKGKDIEFLRWIFRRACAAVGALRSLVHPCQSGSSTLNLVLLENPEHSTGAMTDIKVQFVPQP